MNEANTEVKNPSSTSSNDSENKNSDNKSNFKKELISNLSAGLIAAMLMITMSVCCATFIFSGEHMSIYLPTGIGLALISSIII